MQSPASKGCLARVGKCFLSGDICSHRSCYGLSNLNRNLVLHVNMSKSVAARARGWPGAAQSAIIRGREIQIVYIKTSLCTYTSCLSHFLLGKRALGNVAERSAVNLRSCRFPPCHVVVVTDVGRPALAEKSWQVSAFRGPSIVLCIQSKPSAEDAWVGLRSTKMGHSMRRIL